MAIPRKSSPTATDSAAVNPAVNTPITASPEPPAVAGDEQAVNKPDSTPAALPPQQATPPAPYPAVQVPSMSTAPVSDDDLPSILRRLTPIQRAKLRSAAISEGVIQSGAGRISSDGSLSVVIRVNSDLVPQLQTWAEEAGKSTEEQVREIVDMLLNSYLLSPWEPPQPVAAAAEPVAK